MNTQWIRTPAIAILSLATIAARAGTWTPLAHQPTFMNPPSQCAAYPNANCAPPGTPSSGGVLNANLLTDGSVLFEAIVMDDTTARRLEYRLIPDEFGSYVNGTWQQAASIPDARTPTNPGGWAPYGFASAVLPDGRVIYEGGEDNGARFALSSRGGIYDPTVDSWTPVLPPSFDNLYPAVPPLLPGFNNVCEYPRYPAPFTSQLVDAIGDAQSVVLPDGTFMLASKLSKQQALLDPKTLTWTLTGTNKADVNSEEGWTLLPNGKVLTIDLQLDYWFGLTPQYTPGNSELYDPKTGSWTSAGNTGVILTSFPCGEIGPAVLLPNGAVFATGDNGQTAFYDSRRNTWSPGPTYPLVSINGQDHQFNSADTSVALLPSGNVLISALPSFYDQFVENLTYTKFFEFDGHGFVTEPDTPDSPFGFPIGMLVLPSGQILEYDTDTDIELYNPTPRYGDHRDTDRPWYAPAALEVPHKVSPGGSYLFRGRYLNGVSQGAMVGDDWQAATNYPLVRITNRVTHHVFYSRTHDFSSMAVANPHPVTARFDVPANQEKGPSVLEIVTNGIASEPIEITVD
jgi:hypothetical protein